MPLLFSEPVRGQGVTGRRRAQAASSRVAWGNGIVRPEFYPAGDELVLGEVLQAARALEVEGADAGRAWT